MQEILTRREFGGKVRFWVKGLVAAAALSRLDIGTAYAEQQSVDCPIYMFHETTASTAYLLEWIVASHIVQGKLPVDIRTLAAIARGEKSGSAKQLFALTFDDGLLSQYIHALPVLKRWRVPATFFVIGVDWSDGAHQYMSPQQKQEVASEGFEIGSHTLNHPRNLITLRRNSLGAYQVEIDQSRSLISALIGYSVVSFSSPNSVYDDTLVKDLRGLGYKAAVSTAPNQGLIPSRRGVDELYNLMRQRKS
ncbi:MAG: polysaccharide deacetylase family protein [Candidatus Daviesbacteria bacterium]|nr:polysaccharide deacetylase family protein [Candidatus Daviesbacteria bacterium]